VLKVERIDHGVQCAEDPTWYSAWCGAHPADGVPAVQRQAVRVQGPGAAQPEADARSGLCATINSDDPAYFGGYMNQNFVETFAALPQLGPAEAHALACNSFEASFAPAADKARWRRELDDCFARLAA
jgi:adenosine deaminase